jgi:hypothetical protein
MRAIQVSADVFQAIWAAREAGEDDEDAVLRRLLNVRTAAHQATGSSGKAWIDGQYGITFHHGFGMYRRFKGNDYLAQVVDGKWDINGQKVDAKSINELSKAIGAKRENGWMGWNFRTPSGEEKKIHELRDPERIIRRSSTSRISKAVLDRIDFAL